MKEDLTKAALDEVLWMTNRLEKKLYYTSYDVFLVASGRLN
jgi:hypothetical protein